MQITIIDPADTTARRALKGHGHAIRLSPSNGMLSMDDTADRAQRARETCPFLTSKQAAFHLGLAPSTLKGMRSDGRGPICRRHGGAWRYHIDDIEAWSRARMRGGRHG